MINISIVLEDEDVRQLLNNADIPANEENIKEVIEGELSEEIAKTFRKGNMLALKNLSNKYIKNLKEVLKENKDKFEW